MIFKKKKKGAEVTDNNLINIKINNTFQLKNYTPIEDVYENDFFIAAFPKSGITWMQNLLVGILLDSTSIFLTPKLVNEIIPDLHAKTFYKRFFKNMFFKTHSLPEKQFKKVLHLVRDGRDAMVSYHKMGVNKNVDFHTLYMIW